MRVLLLSIHDIFLYGIKWGFEALGWEAKLGNMIAVELMKQDIETFQPDLIMTLGYPTYYLEKPYILDYLGSRSKTSGYTYIHWDTDGFLGVKYELPLILISKPDAVFTVCREAKAVYEKQYKPVFELRYGVAPHIFSPQPKSDKYEGMVTYVARTYEEIFSTPELIKTKSIHTLVGTLVKNHIKVDTWGNVGTQELYKKWGGTPSLFLYHGFCSTKELGEIYSNCYMNIATQNGLFHISKRTYDILACGGLAISYDTPGIREEFVTGKEVVLASSEAEMLYWTNYYKSHPDEYDAVRRAGYQKVITNYTYRSRVEQLLRQIKL